MLDIIGISGSLRAASYNTAALRAAVGLMPEGAQLEVVTLRGIPLYDGDVEERDGLPSAVQQLKERIVASDGVIFSTPEYNNGIPGVMKNAIDWLSRPSFDISRVFGNRPIAVMGASPGNFGTILAQSAWLPVLRTLGAQPWFGGRLMISRAAQVFGADGEITDEKAKAQLVRFLQGFVASLQTGA